MLSKLNKLGPDVLEQRLKDEPMEYEEVRLMSLRLKAIVEPEKLPGPIDY